MNKNHDSESKDAPIMEVSTHLSWDGKNWVQTHICQPVQVLEWSEDCKPDFGSTEEKR